MKDLKRVIKSKKGNTIIEGTIVMPMIILITILLIRMFTFYLEIFTTTISEHKKAYKNIDAYTGLAISSYGNKTSIRLLPKGILKHEIKKEIYTQVFLFNEDNIARGKAEINAK